MNYQDESRGLSPKTNSKKSQITGRTNHILDEVKKLGFEIYEEGKDKLDEFQDDIKVQSDRVVKKVHEKPISSLLIAAGVGFLLSHLLRR